MTKKINSPLITLALMLSLGTTGEIIKPLGQIKPVFAQEDTSTFVLPETVAADTIVRIDGATAMQGINERFTQEFETKYPGTKVEAEYNDSEAALAALAKGDIDLAALGRNLTDEEKAEGYQEVSFGEFKKIAIIVGIDNPYTGSLTDEQFAQIFRGEIINWSEVGGPDVPIRLIDRAETDDTRDALSKYPVFTEKEFTSKPAETVAEDATLEEIGEKLGADGISYGIYNKTDEIATIRVVPMSDTLPDDPRYPFSQPLVYVYKDQPSEAAKQFLGFVVATSPVVVEETPVVVEETPPVVVEETPVVVEETPPVVVEETPPPVVETPAPTPVETAPAPEAKGGFPWWLLLIPLIGAALWYLLRQKTTEPTAEAATATPGVVPVIPPVGDVNKIIFVPRTCREAYAYWEISASRLERIREEGGRNLSLRLYDLTAGNTENLVSEVECDRDAQDLHLAIPKDNRNYVAELGYNNADRNWISLARSESVLVPACSRIILVPSNCKQAYTYWEVPAAHLDRSKQLKLRLYDVTDQDVNSGEMMSETDCDAQDQDLHISIPVDDRDYVADLGYTNSDGSWLSIARSEAVHVPACPVDGGDMVSATDVVPLQSGDMISAEEVLANENIFDPDSPQYSLQGGISLVARNCREAYARWEVSNALKPSAGEQLLLRLYDVTDRDIDAQESEEILELPCSDTQQDYSVPIPIDGRNYLVELGYLTREGNWFCLARSKAVTVPVCSPTETTDWVEATQVVDNNVYINNNVLQASGLNTTETVTNSEIFLLPRSCREAYAYWTISKVAQDSYHAQGGTTLALRLYDVTSDITAETEDEVSNSMYEFECNNTDTEYYVPIPIDNRDYLIEIGYITEAGGWLILARSESIRIPACSEVTTLN